MSVARRGFGRFRPVFAALALALVPGCGTPNAPLAPPSVRLDLSLSSTSGRPGAPITARATVRNVGSTPVWYMACDGGTIGIAIWEPDRHNVEEACGACPNILCLRCLERPIRLDPGGTLQGERTFEGRLFTCDGFYDVADGEYTFEVAFRGRGLNDETITLTRSAVARWSRP